MAQTHAVKPVPLPSSMALRRPRRLLESSAGRASASAWPESQTAVPLSLPSSRCAMENTEERKAADNKGMCFVRWAGSSMEA